MTSKKFNIKKLKKLTSGGSTGEPFSIYINNKEDAWRKAIYLRANIACGQKPRDSWACVIDSQYSNKISRFIDAGMIEQNGDYFRLSQRGWLLADEVASSF